MTYKENIRPSIDKRMKFFYYISASFVGMILSAIIFYINHKIIDINAYYSNWIGDIFAMFFVFIMSWMFIFDHDGQKIGLKFISSSIAKIGVIFLLSLALSVLETVLYEGRIVAVAPDSVSFILSVIKVALAPVSLILNYLITRLIIELVRQEKSDHG